MPQFSKPEKLTPAHEVEAFDSGQIVLDQWLKTKAVHNERGDASRTYVIYENHQVIGYYTLASGAVVHQEAIGRVKRNMPDPVPVIVLGRLAIDQKWQGQGLGKALLKDALLRVLQAADIIGVKAIIVHALSEEAKAFYEKFGFSASPSNPMTLMITLKDVRGNLVE